MTTSNTFLNKTFTKDISFAETKKLVYIAHNPELHDLTDVVLRLEEDLGSPHVVSLVTDYNVMPVSGKGRGDMQI